MVGWFSHEFLSLICSIGSILIPLHLFFLDDHLSPRSLHLIYIPELSAWLCSDISKCPLVISTWLSLLHLTLAYLFSPGFLFCLGSSGPTHPMIRQVPPKVGCHPIFLLLLQSSLFSIHIATTSVQPTIFFTWVIAASHLVSSPPIHPPARPLFFS